MGTRIHEFRDPIHNFVKLDTQERAVVDASAFQRLRSIHQLGMSHFVYPGANHTRFEHSLGVMELATQVYHTITSPEHLTDELRAVLPEVGDEEHVRYWRRVLRMAALCHDLGHLPFSHAAEKRLLPDGWNHEQITRAIIESGEIAHILGAMTPPLRPDDVAKIALGPKEYRDTTYTTWEVLLSEVIVGDAFGVDRMDYLLRDSHHLGVAYGRFDHFRLVDSLRIAPPPPRTGRDLSLEPTVGVEEGGLHCAEALLLARYFMYSQVYFHHVRRIYDLHLADFLAEWLPGGQFSVEIDQHLAMTDHEVMAALRDAADAPGNRGHDSAASIYRRNHYRLIYKPSSDDVSVFPDACGKVCAALETRYGAHSVRVDRYSPRGDIPDFSVVCDGEAHSAAAVSDVVADMPLAKTAYVFIRPAHEEDAKRWLRNNKTQLLDHPEEP
ncbi:MAG TPA: phosphohydrolase [Armatimonadetes bacterium]|jgi:hypothetical protein|nr:phosphohydrolase [Armatimonadota bacterium]